MATRLSITILIAMLLAACSSIEGMYRPSCIAYEGDEIELADNRYTWRKFTDEMRVDEHGELIEPFPAYPKKGNYSLQESMLRLVDDNDTVLASFHVHTVSGHAYLLTPAENSRLAESADIPDCALRRDD